MGFRTENSSPATRSPERVRRVMARGHERLAAHVSLAFDGWTTMLPEDSGSSGTSVYGLRFRVQGLGLRVGSGFRVKIWCRV